MQAYFYLFYFSFHIMPGDAPPSSTMAEDSNGSKARPGFLRSMMHTLGLDHLKRPRSPSGATQPSDGLSALTLAGSDEGGASTDNLEGQIIKVFVVHWSGNA